MRTTFILIAAVALVALETRPASAQVAVWGGYNPWTGRAHQTAIARNPFTGTIGARSVTVNPWTGRAMVQTQAFNPWTGAGYRTTTVNPWIGRPPGFGPPFRRW